jgi:hypothetical protein
MHRAPVVVVLALLVPLPGWAQEHRHRPKDQPIGPEFRINTTVAGDQRSPSASGTHGSAPQPRWAVVWASDGQDGAGLGVFGRNFPNTAEFRVNTYTAGDQSEPSVDSGGNGFVVAWTSGQDGSELGVFAQRFDANGTPLGPEFQVNTFTTGRQAQPRVSVAGTSGDFVVVWTSDFQDGSGPGVFGQRYAASGVPQGGEFRVNTYTPGYQYHAAVSSDPAGNFVVVWQDGTAPGGGGGQPGRGVLGQRYSSAGVALGPEFQVETYTTGFQGMPAIVVQPLTGSFVVTWESEGQDGSGRGIYAQRFGSDGTPFNSEFRVNTYTTGSQSRPAIACDSAGCFFIAWNTADASGSGVAGQMYFGGQALEPEYRVNTYMTGNQGRPTVGLIPEFDHIIAWDSPGQDGSGSGVYGQMDNHFIPVELMTIGVE